MNRRERRAKESRARRERTVSCPQRPAARSWVEAPVSRAKYMAVCKTCRAKSAAVRTETEDEVMVIDRFVFQHPDHDVEIAVVQTGDAYPDFTLEDGEDELPLPEPVEEIDPLS